MLSNQQKKTTKKKNKGIEKDSKCEPLHQGLGAGRAGAARRGVGVGGND